MDARRLMRDFSGLSLAGGPVSTRSLYMLKICAPLLPLAVLAACGDDGSHLPQGNASNAVERARSDKPLAANADSSGATPMAERVAVIGLLNKRNGLTRDLKMKPGQALRSGDAIVRLRACEATAPWEQQKEVGAFVQLDVRSPRDDKWRRTFSGWLFRERPERNVVQHPIYDVWVKSCEMVWPETGPDTLKSSAGSGANARSAAAPGPADNSSEASPAAPAGNAPSESAPASND